MRGFAGIAAGALRWLVRTRTAGLTALLLVAVNLALPLGFRGDGSAEGALRMHVAYTLGMSGFLLGLFSLWAGCAAVSGEAAEQTLSLVLTKPVGRWAIWAGKWAGVVAVDAGLLAGAAGLSGGVLAWRLRSWEAGGTYPAAELAAAKGEILGCHAEARAAVDDVEEEVEARYGAAWAAGQLPDGVPAGTVKGQLRREILARRYGLEAGRTREWRFEWPAGARTEGASLRWTCDRSTAGGGETRMEWRMGRRDAEGTEAEFVSGVPRRLAWTGGEEARVWGTNRDAEGATLYFDPQAGVTLVAEAGTWGGNVGRGLGLMLLRLAFLAAAGVTLGTVFSRGTAVFLSLALLALLQMAGFVGAAAQTERAVFVANVADFGRGGGEGEATGEAGAWAKAAANGLYWVYRGTWTALRPLLDDRTLDALGTGRRIEAGEAWRRLWVMGVAWPLGLCAVSAAALRRREWAGGGEG